MAKNFPYFKFIATEWMTGDIVFESLSAQGLFINICALYWQRNGELSIDDINKRFKSPSELAELTDRFFSLSGGFISVKFLDEQLVEASHISKVNSQNGSKGGRPKALKTLKEKPTANRPLTDRKAKKSKEEKELNIINQKLLSEINISEVDVSLLHYARTAKEFQRLFIENLEEKNASTVHQKNAKFGTYVTPIRLIIENKEGTIQDLRDVFSYLASPEGEFWKSNILSTAKLREQLPKLLMSARQVKPKQKPKEDKL